jgi:TPR repeat protein
MYEGGIGVPRDAERAKYWKEKADPGGSAFRQMLFPSEKAATHP